MVDLDFMVIQYLRPCKWLISIDMVNQYLRDHLNAQPKAVKGNK